MAKPLRVQRLAERIRQELSEMLLQEVTDPALSGITVTDVEVDREMAFAKVFVSTLEGSERQQEVLDGLERAKGYLRFQLAQRIEVRTFPHLRFKWDGTPERAARIENLLNTIARTEAARPVPVADEETQAADEQ